MSSVAQSSREKVFEFVVSELEAVAGDLPLARNNYLGTYYGRITRPVAWFLLAKLWLNAPVYAGDLVGHARIKVGGDVAAQCSLVAAETVERLNLHNALRRILSLWVLRLQAQASGG